MNDPFEWKICHVIRKGISFAARSSRLAMSTAYLT
jgi:hypothetical protein